MQIKSFPQARPSRMCKLKNQTVYQFADDNTTNSRYTFNSLGYRSDFEFELTNDVVVVLGNTLTFGLGLNIEQTFIGRLSNQISFPIYNFTWGRYGHENNDQLELLKNILSLITPRLVIFQINNLNRHRINDDTVSFDNPIELIIEKHNKFYTELKKTLETIPHVLLYWDDEYHGIDVPDCLINNKYHVDSIKFPTNPDRPVMGVMSHKIIAAKILKEIKEKSLLTNNDIL